jgi:hypothetical protein
MALTSGGAENSAVTGGLSNPGRINWMAIPMTRRITSAVNATFLAEGADCAERAGFAERADFIDDYFW